jgi:hypothetical protein
MPTSRLLTLLCATAILLVPMQGGGQQQIPGTFPPPQQPRPSLPDPNGPPTVVRGDQPIHLDAAKVKEQASQLLKLAQTIPPDIDKVTKGQLPQELIAHLKQVEKLSKELRKQVSP